jgi:SulP family sulfate permease
MKKMSDISSSKSTMGFAGDFAKEEAWTDEKNISEFVQKKVYIKHFEGPIFFGFTTKFQEMHRALPDVKVVIMRMARVPYIDQSGIYAIEDAVLDLKKKGVSVFMIELQDQPKDMLRNIHLIPDLIPEEHLFTSIWSSISALDTIEGINLTS